MKIVSVTGNIKDGVIYRLCPNTEFSIGSWQIAISTISADASQDINSIVNITSSVSVNQKYKDGKVTIYEQPLNSVYLNLRKNSKSINRFTFPIYIDINRQSEEIEFHFIDGFTGSLLNFDVKVSLTVLFKRIA